MRSVKAPLGEYNLYANIDDRLYGEFEVFDIVPGKLSELSVLMGAESAIERRLAINPDLPQDLIINYHGKSLGKSARGVDIFGRKTSRHKKYNRMPLADIHISPMATLEYILSAREPEEASDIEETIQQALERVTRHEISHFVDPEEDPVYAQNLSRRRRRKIEHSVTKKQMIHAAWHPEVCVLQDRLDKLLPKGILERITKILSSTIKEEIEDSIEGIVSKITGIPPIRHTLKSEELSISGLRTEIDNLRFYYLLPREVAAKSAEKSFQNIGHFCCLELKPEALIRVPEPRTRLAGWLNLLSNATIRER